MQRDLVLEQTISAVQPSERFDGLPARFLASVPAQRTRETYARELALFQAWLGEDCSISKAGLDDLLRYRLYLEPRYKPATVAKKVASLRSFFRFAKKTGARVDNPGEDVRVRGAPRGRIPTHLTSQEVERLVKMPDRRTLLGKRDAAILALLPRTGMRREELVNLRLNSFIYHRERYQRQESAHVKILGKGNKERLVRVHESVLPYLESWVETRPTTDHDFFFTTINGDPLTLKAVRYLIQKHGQAAGIPEEKLHPHSFRHTFCMDLARAGVPLHVIQELTGHTNLNTLRIYLKVTGQEGDEAIGKLPGLGTPRRGAQVFR